MKLIVRMIGLVVLLATYLTAAEMPFHRGLNFAEWLQKPSAEQIQFTRFTRQDFVHVKRMGCDHIRLPMHLFNMCGKAPDFTIDPLFFSFLDQIVDWAEELDLKLILDNHSFDPAVNTTPDILDRLIAVWQQMAERYKSRSNLIYYEILNEPHGIDDNVWNSMQQKVLNAIRAIDSTHTIVVGPANWNSFTNLDKMPEYQDDNIIYTFHFYDPFLFTHQGASWVDPPLDIAGVPYPYDATRMPSLPSSLKGTWIEGIYRTYPYHGSDNWVKSRIDIAVDFMNGRNVPVWCGEFGVYQKNSRTEDRVHWLKTVRTYFEEKGIAWTMWEYASGFGIFKKGSNRLFDYDVDIPIVEALGLTPPPQKQFELVPDTTGFNIYDDYIAPGLLENSWLSRGKLSYYCQDNPFSGSFCIYWTGAEQYNTISVRFAPIKDMSKLVADGYALDFRVRCDQPDAKFDVRFLDTKTDDPDDHPWRMAFTIDGAEVHFNGAWQHLQIPLQRFREQGSWDNNRWYDPQGKFDWTRTEQFQIVAEHYPLDGIQLYFDDIQVVNPQQANIENGKEQPEPFAVMQNYPNPFNPSTNIPFILNHTEDVTLTIYNISGQQVYRTVQRKLPPGRHKFTWIANEMGLSSGLYFYQIATAELAERRPMLYLR